ncbi:DUF4252 domain-containing protein [Aureispira anguillae]|uniref:DUF4252 domain-containing protein n=1 Tax=Aureispira anguillae TaxID=2864201 RepID=A0A916DU74_9BACT|nr:DUF4252 domain-containing protein [Aureispira anguillae]BDS12026.1 DUF4252 domain-containing protein [Aureispira anguillae]
MKNIITTIVLATLIIQGAWAQNNAIDKYFKKYEDSDAFTSVYVSEYMFSLFADIDMENPEDKEVMEILNGLKGLQVLTTDKSPQKYYEEAIQLINQKEYKVLMKVKDEGTNVRFLIKKEKNSVKELLLLVGGDEFVLLSIVGNINLNKISKLAKHMDIQGLEHLDKVEEAEAH